MIQKIFSSICTLIVLGVATDTALRFDFQRTDNIPAATEGIDFLDHGARFNYRYQSSPD